LAARVAETIARDAVRTMSARTTASDRSVRQSVGPVPLLDALVTVSSLIVLRQNYKSSAAGFRT
jgi:hypothetical protein